VATSLDYVQARVGQAGGEHACVAQRDAGVVFAGHDQASVRHTVQPRETGPATAYSCQA